MKVAIVVEGTRGDVYPMLALGRSLLAAGHAVRLCAPPDFGEVAEAQGIEFRAMGESVRDFLTGAAGALHSRGLHFFAEMDRFARQSMALQLRLLPDLVRGADRVVAAGTAVGAASAAELHAIPYRYIVYTPALLPSLEHGPAMLPFQTSSPTANRWLWRLGVGMMQRMVSRRLDPLRREIGLPRVRDMVRYVAGATPIVAADRPLAPVPADCPFPFRQIRCLHPDECEPLPPKLEAFLEHGDPPVYLGFGSMTDPDPAATTRHLLDALSSLGCRAILDRGWAGLGEGPLPDGVMAIEPVSHAALFPRCAAVVHHGGAGTTHTAARAGVPQLLVPHVLDQFYFAKRVHTLGVGPEAIPRTRLGVERLLETLRAMLDNELLAERARELASELRALGPIEIDPAVVLD